MGKRTWGKKSNLVTYVEGKRRSAAEDVPCDQVFMSKTPNIKVNNNGGVARGTSARVGFLDSHDMARIPCGI